jgi:hypothetical protein
MIQTQAVQSLADAHRRDLMASAGSRRAAPQGSTSEIGVVQRSAPGLPVTGGRAVHRAVAPRLGAWLIEFGTRLGGTTIRTS